MPRTSGRVAYPSGLRSPLVTDPRHPTGIVGTPEVETVTTVPSITETEEIKEQELTGAARRRLARIPLSARRLGQFATRVSRRAVAPVLPPGIDRSSLGKVSRYVRKDGTIDLDKLHQKYGTERSCELLAGVGISVTPRVLNMLRGKGRVFDTVPLAKEKTKLEQELATAKEKVESYQRALAKLEQEDSARRHLSSAERRLQTAQQSVSLLQKRLDAWYDPSRDIALVDLNVNDWATLAKMMGLGGYHVVDHFSKWLGLARPAARPKKDPRSRRMSPSEVVAQLTPTLRTWYDAQTALAKTQNEAWKSLHADSGMSLADWVTQAQLSGRTGYTLRDSLTAWVEAAGEAAIMPIAAFTAALDIRDLTHTTAREEAPSRLRRREPTPFDDTALEASLQSVLSPEAASWLAGQARLSREQTDAWAVQVKELCSLYGITDRTARARVVLQVFPSSHPAHTGARSYIKTVKTLRRKKARRKAEAKAARIAAGKEISVWEVETTKGKAQFSGSPAEALGKAYLEFGGRYVSVTKVGAVTVKGYDVGVPGTHKAVRDAIDAGLAAGTISWESTIDRVILQATDKEKSEGTIIDGCPVSIADFRVTMQDGSRATIEAFTSDDARERAEQAGYKLSTAFVTKQVWAVAPQLGLATMARDTTTGAWTQRRAAEFPHSITVGLFKVTNDLTGQTVQIHSGSDSVLGWDQAATDARNTALAYGLRGLAENFTVTKVKDVTWTPDKAAEMVSTALSRGNTSYGAMWKTASSAFGEEAAIPHDYTPVSIIGGGRAAVEFLSQEQVAVLQSTDAYQNVRKGSEHRKLSVAYAAYITAPRVEMPGGWSMLAEAIKDAAGNILVWGWDSLSEGRQEEILTELDTLATAPEETKPGEVKEEVVDEPVVGPQCSVVGPRCTCGPQLATYHLMLHERDEEGDFKEIYIQAFSEGDARRRADLTAREVWRTSKVFGTPTPEKEPEEPAEVAPEPLTLTRAEFEETLEEQPAVLQRAYAFGGVSGYNAAVEVYNDVLQLTAQVYSGTVSMVSKTTSDFVRSGDFQQLFAHVVQPNELSDGEYAAIAPFISPMGFDSEGAYEAGVSKETINTFVLATSGQELRDAVKAGDVILLPYGDVLDKKSFETLPEVYQDRLREDGFPGLEAWFAEMQAANIAEGVGKNTRDALYLNSVGMKHDIHSFSIAELEGILRTDYKAGERKPWYTMGALATAEGRTIEEILAWGQADPPRTGVQLLLTDVKARWGLTDRPDWANPYLTAAEAAALNEYNEKGKVALVEIYERLQRAHENWRAERPLLQPVFPEGPLQAARDNPRNLLNPLLYTECMAATAPYTMATLGAMMIGNAIGGPVGLGIASSFAFGITWSVEGHQIYQDVLDNGGTRVQAHELMNTHGAISAAIETAGDAVFIGVLGATSRAIMKSFGKNVATDVIGGAAKRYGWRKLTGSIVVNFFNQAMQESAQQVVANAAVRTVNENRPLLEGAADAFVAGLIGTAPFILIPAGGQAVRMTKGPQGTIPQPIASDVMMSEQQKILHRVLRPLTRFIDQKLIRDPKAARKVAKLYSLLGRAIKVYSETSLRLKQIRFAISEIGLAKNAAELRALNKFNAEERRLSRLLEEQKEPLQRLTETAMDALLEAGAIGKDDPEALKLQDMSKSVIRDIDSLTSQLFGDRTVLDIEKEVVELLEQIQMIKEEVGRGGMTLEQLEGYGKLITELEHQHDDLKKEAYLRYLATGEEIKLSKKGKLAWNSGEKLIMVVRTHLRNLQETAGIVGKGSTASDLILRKLAEKELFEALEKVYEPIVGRESYASILSKLNNTLNDLISALEKAGLPTRKAVKATFNLYAALRKQDTKLLNEGVRILQLEAGKIKDKPLQLKAAEQVKLLESVLAQDLVRRFQVRKAAEADPARTAEFWRSGFWQEVDMESENENAVRRDAERVVGLRYERLLERSPQHIRQASPSVIMDYLHRLYDDAYFKNVYQGEFADLSEFLDIDLEISRIRKRTEEHLRNVQKLEEDALIAEHEADHYKKMRDRVKDPGRKATLSGLATKMEEDARQKKTRVKTALKEKVEIDWSWLDLPMIDTTKTPTERGVALAVVAKKEIVKGETEEETRRERLAKKAADERAAREIRRAKEQLAQEETEKKKYEGGWPWAMRGTARVRRPAAETLAAPEPILLDLFKKPIVPRVGIATVVTEEKQEQLATQRQLAQQLARQRLLQTRTRVQVQTQPLPQPATQTETETLLQRQTRVALQTQQQLQAQPITPFATQQRQLLPALIPPPLPPFPPVLTLGDLEDAYKKGLPILIWRQGSLNDEDVWKAVIDPQKQTNLLTVVGTAKLPTRPKVIATGPGSAKLTMQWLGKGPRHKGSADLGIMDVFWDRSGRNLRFEAGGLKTDVGARVPGPTKGITIEGPIDSAGGVLETEPRPVLKPKSAKRVKPRKKRHRGLTDWEYATTLKGFDPYTGRGASQGGL